MKVKNLIVQPQLQFPVQCSTSPPKLSSSNDWHGSLHITPWPSTSINLLTLRLLSQKKRCPWVSVLLAKMNRTAFFSSFTINKESSSRQSCISLSLRLAPWDSAKTLVHPSGYPIEAPPIYSIISQDTAPNVVLLRGWGDSTWDIVGDARLPTLSSKIHLTFYGRPINMC